MTAEDQIKTLRYYWHDAVVVAVFTNGTVIVCKDLAHAPTIMAAYDVPHDGEGGPPGDMHPLSMDDGNTLIAFRAPSEWDATVPVGQAVRVTSNDDLTALAGMAKPSSTEVLLGGPPQDLVERARLAHACVAARRARTQDAQHPVLVASWSPEERP
jgi:hypothetical protein